MMIRFKLTAICVLFLSFATSAQNLSQGQVKLVLKGIDSLLTTYSKLGTLMEDGQLKVSDLGKSRYYSLFKDSFTNVYGDLMYERNAELIKDGKKPKLITIPLKEYVEKSSTKFRYGIKIKIVNFDADLKALKNNTIKVMLEQDLTGIKSKGKEVANQDTVAINIEFSQDYTKAKIAGIFPTGLGGHVTVKDADMDEIEAKKKAMKAERKVVKH